MTGVASDRRWSLERVRSWWREGAWPVGCNFIPSTAVNQLEMWQAATFDPETSERELGWARGLGFNAIRVYLHDLAWEQERDGFLERIDRFLAIAASRDQRVMFVLFDDVWNPEPRPGPQPEPHPGRHNAGWVAGPGLGALEAYESDPSVRARLEAYVKGVVGAFADDPRVWVWDVYNEPGGYPNPGADPVGPRCLPLLRDVFGWARSTSPMQPLTSGLWWTPLKPVDPAIHAVQLAESDVLSFHHYGPPDDLIGLCDRIAAKSDRPLVCTEYLARQLQSKFETHLPIFRERDIGAICWGLVAGRTQTIYPWWSWFDKEPKPEPEVWFHDIFRPDGTPWSAVEVDAIRRSTSN
jgi:hypothetical protein